MGTMFDVVVYHASKAEAERAVDRALDEVVRLDQVLSHYKADSDLSRLNREARHGFVTADPSLYEVVREALEVSRNSGGTFDITIAPLLRVWKEAYADGRRPAAWATAAAQRCVGYEMIELGAPDRIRFRSDCLEIELGGIGKGYAVDRAIAVLRDAGIRHGLVNAGSSSIASIGSPPGRNGWEVRLGRTDRTLLLRDGSISTSQQNPLALAFEPGELGEIIDPRTGAPAPNRTAVSVTAPSATLSDALSTTVLLLSMEEATRLLAHYAAVSAFWITPKGELTAAYGASQLASSDSR